MPARARSQSGRGDIGPNHAVSSSLAVLDRTGFHQAGFQKTSQPTNPPTHPPTHPPTNQPTHQPTNPPTNQPTNQPTNPPTNPPTNQPTNPPTQTHPPTNQTPSPGGSPRPSSPQRKPAGRICWAPSPCRDSHAAPASAPPQLHRAEVLHPRWRRNGICFLLLFCFFLVLWFACRSEVCASGILGKTMIVALILVVLPRPLPCHRTTLPGLKLQHSVRDFSGLGQAPVPPTWTCENPAARATGPFGCPEAGSGPTSPENQPQKDRCPFRGNRWPW